jgi:FKBP-type peptidyl-prolyl cis-trans isomerase FkpA
LNYIKKCSSLFLLAIITTFTCAAGDVKNDYKTDPATGVRYLFIKQNKKGIKPAMGDIAFVRLEYKREDDSLLFNSHAGGRTDSTSEIPLTIQATFHGCLEQGIAMMSVGDSASFLINADSIYLKVFKVKTFPKFIKEGSSLKFYIKLVRFETPSQLKDDQYAMIEKRRAEDKRVQSAETDSIKKYLADKNIKVKPTMVDSLYILQRTGTIGRPINIGDSVEVKYTGMFLDGSVFDQSDRGDGSKGTFKLVYTRNAKLIRGWIEVLQTMHEGEKVRFLLPSSLAYGPAGMKAIKPYTPLLFELEVIKVSSPFDK